MQRLIKIPFLCDCKKVTLLVVLIFFCMFVVQNNCREIYDYNFINNKELPKGNKSERLVYLTLQLFCNPTGDSVYKTIFDMQNENSFVTTSENAGVTPLHNILVNSHFNLKKSLDFARCYWQFLPFCKTQEDAFYYVNEVHYKRHNAYKFLSYKSFKSEIYA